MFATFSGPDTSCAEATGASAARTVAMAHPISLLSNFIPCSLLVCRCAPGEGVPPFSTRGVYTKLPTLRPRVGVFCDCVRYYLGRRSQQLRAGLRWVSHSGIRGGADVTQA